MEQAFRQQLFDRLMRGADEQMINDPIGLRVFEESTTEDLDGIEPMIDDYIKTKLTAFADKLEAAILARDFHDDWGPLDVQRSCSEMVHEVLTEFRGS